MTQQESDLLLQLCKPYLLNLSSLIVESLKFPGGEQIFQDLKEFQEKQDYSFSSEILEIIDNLSYSERASLLQEIVTWINSAASK